MNNRPKSMTFAAQQRSYQASDKSKSPASKVLPDDGEEVRREPRRSFNSGSDSTDKDSSPSAVKQRTEIYKDGELYGSQG